MITPDGRSLVTKGRLSHHEFIRHIFGDALTDTDLADLTRVMSRISAYIPGQSATA